MRIGVVADVHGNEVALRAVLADAAGFGVERWWALGDLVLFGPRPAETLETLRALPGIAMLRGNTDRYVLTGEQPIAHPTAEAAAAGGPDLVRRYAATAAGIAWTRGVLDQAGLLDGLTALPPRLRRRLPSGARLLGVHASPHADDGPGIAPGTPEDEMRRLLAGCGADVVVGGHTHRAADRRVDGVRALNPGSAGLPLDGAGTAGWLLLDDDGTGVTATLRTVPFDAAAVVDDLHRRRHPNADFVAALLTDARRPGGGRRRQGRSEEGAAGR